MKGYKAFKKGMTCRGKQYAENSTFEEDEARVCNSGMHFCVNPLDTLNYYPLLDENCELSDFAEVEALDTAHTYDNKKYCTKKLRIGAKLNLKDFIKASIDFVFENNSPSSGNHSKLISSLDYAQLSSSEDNSQLVSSGNSSQLASSGDNSKLVSSGKYSWLSSSGYGSQLVSSGYAARLSSSGDCVKLASSGDCVKLSSSGNCAKLASSGDCAQLSSSGNYARLSSSGNNSIVICTSMKGMAKAKKKSWITLAEWEWDNCIDEYIPKCVKTVQVDGEIIKEDTFYKLENGEFVEVQDNERCNYYW